MEIKNAIDALSALAQESRLAIFRLLVQAGPEGLSAGAISEAIGIPSTTLSFHLAQLSQAGLLHPRRVGRSIYYAVDFNTISRLIGFLTENCCGGQPQQCLPTLHKENAP